MAGSQHHLTPGCTETGEAAQRRLTKQCIQGAEVRSKVKDLYPEGRG